MQTSELLKKVRKIEIKSKGLSNQIFSGEYHSAFKGRGMSFSEVREYAPGDDIKTIDWNVTARYRKPYVKLFQEERELTVMLLIDISRSNFFGTAQQMKHELMTEIAAVLAFSAINNNDKIGCLFFSSTIEQFIPPKKGRSHVLRIIREILEYSYGSKMRPLPTASEIPPLPNAPWSDKLKYFLGINRFGNTASKSAIVDTDSQHTDLGNALGYFSNVIKKKCIAFVLSDFYDEGYEKALNLAARRHDLIGINIYDPRDAALPNIGLLKVVDAETGKAAWVDTNDENAMEHYSQYFSTHLNNTKQYFAKAKADLINIPTDEAYVKHLMVFFKHRGA